MIFIIKGFRTIVFIFSVISTSFWPEDMSPKTLWPEDISTETLWK